MSRNSPIQYIEYIYQIKYKYKRVKYKNYYYFLTKKINIHIRPAKPPIYLEMLISLIYTSYPEKGDMVHVLYPLHKYFRNTDHWKLVVVASLIWV
jgi:hypothetical protein